MAVPLKKTNPRPRKCTLTQQQKNHKRQRANPFQTEELNKMFEVTRTPSFADRKAIGKKIDMTPRSVQIWFQNKRAKTKKFAKRQEETSCDRHMFEKNSTVMFNSENGYYRSTFNQVTKVTTPLPVDVKTGDERPKVSPSPLSLSCYSLIIGTWTCSGFPGSSSAQFQVLYHPSERALTYSMLEEGNGLKITVPFRNVDSVDLSQDDEKPDIGHMWLKLSGAPIFSTLGPDTFESEAQRKWNPCPDFTPNEQASHACVHELVGNYESMEKELQKLYSFQPTKIPSGIPTPPTSKASSIDSHYLKGDSTDSSSASGEQDGEGSMISTGMLSPNVLSLDDLLDNSHHLNIENMLMNIEEKHIVDNVREKRSFAGNMLDSPIDHDLSLDLNLDSSTSDYTIDSSSNIIMDSHDSSQTHIENVLHGENINHQVW